MGEDYTNINVTLAMHWLIQLGTVHNIIFQQDIGDKNTYSVSTKLDLIIRTNGRKIPEKVSMMLWST